MEHNLKYLVDCVRVFQVCGTISSKFKFGRQIYKENESKLVSISLKIYSFLINLSMLYLDLIFLTELNEEQFDENLNSKTLFNKILQNTMHIGITMMLIILATKSLLATDFENLFFSNCHKINVLINKNFMKQVDFKKFRKNHYREIKFLIFFAIGCISILVYSSGFDILDMIQLSRISLPLFMASTMVIFRILFFIRVINYHLDHVNNILKEIFASETRDFVIQKKFKSLLSKKSYGNQNQCRLVKMKALMVIYSITEENTFLFNKSEIFSVLFTMLLNMITIIASGYRLIMFGFGKNFATSIGGEKLIRNINIRRFKIDFDLDIFSRSRFQFFLQLVCIICNLFHM